MEEETTVLKKERTNNPAQVKSDVIENKVEYSVSAGLGHRINSLAASIAVTSYQSNAVYFIGVKPQGGVNIHTMPVTRPMGICRDGSNGLSIACQRQILHLQNILAENERMNNCFDVAFMARRSEYIGELDQHDLGIDAEGNAVFVNTRFNCLATPDIRHNFREIWRPDFVSKLVSEDRCHLNGMAMQDGAPRYVTAVSRSDTIDGWRDRRADGGVVIDVTTGDVVCEGLSMPHSPRLHHGRLWVLNSGSGELGEVVFDGENAMGRFEARVFCPGFLRGLAFHGDYAFVGLSRPRYKRFEGLELDHRLRDTDSAPWCGIQIIDLKKGTCVDWFRIDGAVAEIYDLELINGYRCPIAIPPDAPEAASIVTIGH
ncbi:TIGR03032 family protein [Ruegeria atlantica]|uniref:TIGR03032 family protein n=1 Tax=Ruegeria atlantica TaxID=81569 RepID=UPI00148099D8|nr:TIGR03032 family protein [Ruegeria atlantica]